jgi:hypothetical protein
MKNNHEHPMLSGFMRLFLMACCVFFLFLLERLWSEHYPAKSFTDERLLWLGSSFFLSSIFISFFMLIPKIGYSDGTIYNSFLCFKRLVYFNDIDSAKYYATPKSGILTLEIITKVNKKVMIYGPRTFCENLFSRICRQYTKNQKA